jgi:hypothetical protein
VFGGVVRSSSNPEFVGFPFVMYMKDNGPPSSAVDDRANAPFFLGPGDTFPGEPAKFPKVCPASADNPLPDIERDVQWGDIRVIDAG